MVNDLMDFLLGADLPGHEATRSHSWPFPPSVTILLIVAIGIYVGAVYARERGNAGRLMKVLLASIRVCLVALVLFMMYGWMLHRHRTDLPDLVLMLDDSESMALADHYDDDQQKQRLVKRLRNLGMEELSRLNLAKLLLLEDDAELLQALRNRYNLKVYRIGGTARAQSLATDDSDAGPTKPPASDPPASLPAIFQAIEATESASLLGKGVRDVLQSQRGRPTAAIIVLTDGVTTEGRTIGEIAEYARRKVVPLYLVGIGNDKPPRDVRVSDLLVDDVAFVGDLVSFDFKVTGTGYSGKKVKIRLKRKDMSDQVLAEAMIVVGEDGLPKSAQLGHRPPEKGDFEYVVDVESLDGEANLENNRQSHIVKVRDETLRVLFVQEYPSFEFRFLKSMLNRELKRDGDEKAIELTTVLQEADLEYTELDETAERVFPVSREELFRYDVLIFGDVNPSFLSRSVMENISAFVEERGGGLIFLAGPRHTPMAYRDTPLEKLFPVELATAVLPPRDVPLDFGFSLSPTRLGIASPQLQLDDDLAGSLTIWRDLPPFYWLLQTPDLRPGARVLAEEPMRTSVTGENLSIISMQFFGAGKVVFHAFDESYRWSRTEDGDIYYSRYWIQTLRYLSRSKLLGESRTAELTSDRAEYRRGDAVRLRVRFFDDRLAPPQDDGVTAVLEMDGGKRRQIQLNRDAVNRGIFEGTVSNLPEGRYRAWIATPTMDGQPPSQRFSVVAPPGELMRMEMDAADLQMAAKTSQGKYYSFATADDLLEELPRGRQVRIETLPPSPIWNSAFLAALFVVLIASEWLLRKRVGLL